MRRFFAFLVAGAAALGATAWAVTADKPTVEEARAFTSKAEARLLELGNRQQRAAWVQATYITDDTEQIAAEANKDLIAATVEYAVEATKFDGLDAPRGRRAQAATAEARPSPCPRRATLACRAS